jgi:hypothetical protein
VHACAFDLDADRALRGEAATPPLFCRPLV